MSEMIERMCDAMLRAELAGGDTRSMARAALLAIREPTMAMRTAGRLAVLANIDGTEGLRAWQAMIETALQDKP